MKKPELAITRNVFSRDHFGEFIPLYQVTNLVIPRVNRVVTGKVKPFLTTEVTEKNGISLIKRS